jgi:hypothetical protein
MPLEPDQNRPESLLIQGRLVSKERGVVHCKAERRRQRGRVCLTREERITLLDLSGEPPACWICGHPFSSISTDNFLNVERREIPLPEFVDLLKPRGLKTQDFRIEVDHVRPYSLGGEDGDNLKLSCGWCNRQKAALESIYDVPGRPRQNKGMLSEVISSLPQPFWVVRVLALSEICQHQQGCSAQKTSSILTIAPRSMSGSMVPSNLCVVCNEHDPLKNVRFQPRRVVEKLWSQGV